MKWLRDNVVASVVLGIALSVIILWLSSCAPLPGMKHGRNELFPGHAKPRPQSEIKVNVTRGNYFEIGWKCAEVCGYPKWMFPLFLSFWGCSIVPNDAYLNGDDPWCDIWASTDDAEEEERIHCEGYKR